MISVIIFSVLITQSSASFFNDFAQALGSVESKVGKLLTDVKTDLRDTYDCAIDAVEEVFYDKDQIPKYYDKCKETSTETNAVAAVKGASQTIKIYVKPIDTGGSKDVTTKISDAKVGSKDIDKKLANVEKVVNNEYYRVDNMSSHLEHEFDGLSKSIDEKLRLIEKEKEDFQKTLLEIKNLHLEEEMQIERTKDEIRKIFDDILKKINISTKESDLKNEINAIMGDIEKISSKTIIEEIEKWKDKGIEQLKDLQKADTSTNRSSTESNMPRTFQELAAKISKESTNNPNKEISTSNPTDSSKISQGLSSSKISSREIVTRPSTSDVISKTKSVTQSSTDVTSISKKQIVQASTAVTSTPNKRILDLIESVTQSSMVATTTKTFSLSTPVTKSLTSATTISAPLSTLASTFSDPIDHASTLFTTPIAYIATTERVKRASVQAIVLTEPVVSSTIIMPSTELVNQNSTINSTTSVELVTWPSTVSTAISLEPMSLASPITTTTSTEPTQTSKLTIISTKQVTLASVVTTTTRTEPMTKASTVATPITTETVSQVSTISIATSTEPITLTPVVTTNASTETVTQMLTSTTREKLIPSSTTVPYLINTLKPITEAGTTITTPAETMSRPTPKPKRRNKKLKRKFRHTTPKHPIRVPPLTPLYSNRVDKHAPKNTFAAVAEALKIFSKSLKTKPVLDKFFNNIDSVPKSKVIWN